VTTTDATPIHTRTCNLCECMCGLQVPVVDGVVGTIRGDRDDVWSHGYLCPKGTTLGHLHHDPDRLRRPMVRDGDQWREVSWDDAFRRCEELIRPIVERDGVGAFTPDRVHPAPRIHAATTRSNQHQHAAAH
jgi:anaerobic selenocysteine-containing dehydrogenase